MAQRIKGQEVSVLIIVGGVTQATLTDIHNSEFTINLDILEEGYLGETTDRYDEIFKGVTGKLEMHLESEAIFNFVAQIVDRARRRTPGVVVNVKSTFNFPNGDRPRIILKDLSFGNIPFATPSRQGYVNTSLEFKSGDYGVIG